MKDKRMVRLWDKKRFKKIVAVVMGMAVALTAVNFPTNPTIVKAENSSVELTIMEASAPGDEDRGESYQNLIDGNLDTKWCGQTTINREDGPPYTGKAYIIIRASENISVSGYTVSTANDTEDYVNRTPKSWELLACNDYDIETGLGSWQNIDIVSDSKLPTGNKESKTYTIGGTAGFYQYYKWNLRSGSDLKIQLSEFALQYKRCEEHSYETTIVESTCTSEGYEVKECTKCHTKRILSNGQPMKEHQFESGRCIVCNQLALSQNVYMDKADFGDESEGQINVFNKKYNLNGGRTLKVNFGSSPNGPEPQTWYVAGKNRDDATIVLVCDPDNLLLPAQEYTKVENTSLSGKARCEYSTSDLRKYLLEQGIYNFNNSEQEFMANTNIRCHYHRNFGETYSLDDKLYIPSSKDGKEIYVGNASDDFMYGAFKLDYTKGVYEAKYSYWTRETDENSGVIYVSPPSVMDSLVYGYVDATGCRLQVLPVFHLDLSSLLFASTAKADTANATFTGAMSFRFDGTDKIHSSAVACTDNIYVDKQYDNEEYLYVQGKDNGKDWIYSKRITQDETISRTQIEEAVSQSGIHLTQSKIWIEYSENRIHYAKPVNSYKQHDFAGQSYKVDGDGEYYQECKRCGQESDHITHNFSVKDEKKHECQDCHVVDNHKFSDYQSIDGSSHKASCSDCGYEIQENHDFANQVYIKDTDGRFYQKCKKCGQESQRVSHIYSNKSEEEHYCTDCYEEEKHDFIKADGSNTGEEACSKCGAKNIACKEAIKVDVEIQKGKGFLNPPKVSVKTCEGTRLVENKDYNVTYEKNNTTYVGYVAYLVTIKGQWKYAGQITKNVIVNLNEVTMSVIEGEPYGSGREACTRIIDGKPDTKWCAETSDGSAYTIIKVSEPIYVNEYIISTANDTSSYIERNPKSWKLWACNDYNAEDKTGSWEKIAQVTDGDLPKANNASKAFALDTDWSKKAYQYYKWEITSLNGEVYKMLQVGGFELSYQRCEHSYEKIDEKEANCTEKGYDILECTKCHSQIERVNGHPATGHQYHNSICMECGEAGDGPNNLSCKELLILVEEKEVTCEEAGNIEYFVCEKCGTYYLDETATTAIRKESVIIPQIPIETPVTTATPTPTVVPTVTPTEAPTVTPTEAPTAAPTVTPTETPTATPTVAPTEAPTEAPTVTPTEVPTAAPTVAPTEVPTAAPTVTPTEVPTAAPTVAPTEVPTVTPTEVPTEAPTVAPTEVPTAAPTVTPTEAPTAAPTVTPTEAPTAAPTVIPSEVPTATPMVTATESPVPTTTPGEITLSIEVSSGDPVPTILPKSKLQNIEVAKIKAVKASTLKKKAIKIKLKVKVEGKGTFTYKVTKYPKKMKKYIKVSKTGVVTLKKKAKKGTYQITITLAASGAYQAARKKVSIKVE